MASTAQSDFVNVQLSAAGAQIAGADKPIRITTPHFSYVFTASGSTRVLASEWARLLSKEKIDGALILQLAPAVVVQVPAGASAADQLAAVKSEEAALDAQIAAAQTQPAPAPVPVPVPASAKGSK
jgi:hypothetical protein